MGRFDEVYRRSLAEPEEFWAEAAARIDWVKPWERVLDDSGAPFYRWFTGGRLNTCYNALDRHVERGRADQLALIYDSPVTDTVESFTYRELRDEVACFAGALAAQGVECEVVDLRTTSPLDEDTVLESVEGTGRLVVVDEAHPRCNIATDISALVARKAFGSLRAPIEMVTAPHTPVPFSNALEDIYIPDAQRVVNAVKTVTGWTR